jgi:putative phosphoesterase
MTRIGVLSDTHNYLDDRIFTHFADCDEVWHAGDIGSVDVVEKLKSFRFLRAVYGNIDGHELRREFPLYNTFKIEDVSVLLTHIGGYPGKYARDVLPQIFTQKPNLFVCGHSHILKVQYDKSFDMLCINPGSAGLYGFHSVRTLLKFEINGNQFQNMQVIELAPVSVNSK